MDIETLPPAAVWKHFSALCAVPRPSHHEEAVCRFLLERTRSMGLEASRDATGNLVILKPASPGMEERRGIVLQAHVDMVAQAAPGSAHDFLRDPIVPRLDPADPAWITATGTTLGADNGIGVAMALAILEEPGLEHGPLACILTVNEEDGMSGARGLESAPLPDGFLLNLDGELENELTIGCAGSVRSYATMTGPAAPAPAGARRYRLSLDGLLGGHSGVDIDKHRANANVELARILSAAIDECGLSRSPSSGAATRPTSSPAGRAHSSPWNRAGKRPASRPCAGRPIAPGGTGRGANPDSRPGWKRPTSPRTGPSCPPRKPPPCSASWPRSPTDSSPWNPTCPAASAVPSTWAR